MLASLWGGRRAATVAGILTGAGVVGFWLLAANGISCSMSRQGNCYDNAPVESFFATLKKELLDGDPPRSREAVRAEIFEYIEVFYNRIRRHSRLGYLSPMEYERRTDWANAVSA